jgi:nucleotide-binding universal stress UspA family protein
MRYPTTILVAHDFSKGADRAVRRALALCTDAGRIIVFSASDDASAKADLELRLASMVAPRATGAQRMAEKLSVEVSASDPAAAASEIALRTGAGLLVLGLHGKRGLASLLASDTSARILASCPVPALVAVASRPKTYRNIVVGMDFSAKTHAALRTACRWFPDAVVTTVHAFDFNPGRRTAGPITAADLDKSRRAWLERVVIDTVGHGRRVRAHLAHGDPADAIRTTARGGDFDLVVIGRQDRGPLMGRIFGSVGRRLLADLPCDLLMVPDSNEDATD